ncbi:Ubiquitin carboxyl-terminal hydrolase 25 [Galdieria sulphuraria]|nr:Ubiquitin carboxyl-terminal hydrolase 25 [Galdieria sulphuraria]
MNASLQTHLTEMGFSKQDVDRAEAAGCSTVDEAVNFLFEHKSSTNKSTIQRIAGTVNLGTTQTKKSKGTNHGPQQTSIREYGEDHTEGPSLLFFAGFPTNGLSKEKKPSENDLTKALAISKRETSPPEERQPSNLEDKDTQRAIEESLMTSDPHHAYSVSEPFDPSRRKRSSPFAPVGLRNVANICYVNSLLQVYFTLPAIRKAVFSFKHEEFEQLMKEAENHSQLLEDEQGGCSLVQLRNAVDFVVELQNLFGRMALSEEKYLDPQRLIETLKSDTKYGLQIGGQQDASEFNQIFLELLEMGVSATQLLERKLNDSKKNMETNSHVEQIVGSHKSCEDSIQSSFDNIVKNTFTSQLKQEIFVDFRALDEERKTIKVAEQTHETNSVIIDATTPSGDERNLYRGLDELTCSEIEFHIDKESDVVKQLPHSMTDSIEFFRSPYVNKGDFVDWTQSSSIPAYQRLWFVHIAPVVTIYLQRVRFNKETLTPEKVHDSFHFPGSLKMSHYLEHQKEAAEELRRKSEFLRQQFQETIKKLNEQRWFGFLNESEQQTFPFMETLKFSSALNRVIQRLRYLSEMNENDFDVSQQELESCLSILKKLNEKELALEKRLVNKKEQLLEEEQNLRTFISDEMNAVSWDQVLLDSVGGNKFASAYGIIYIDDYLVESFRHSRDSQSSSIDGQISMDCKWYYEIRKEAYELLPPEILEQIKKENDAFMNELNRYDWKKSEQEWKQRVQELIQQAQEAMKTSFKQIKDSDYSFRYCLSLLPNFCLATEQYDLAIFLNLAVSYANYSEATTSLLHDIQRLHHKRNNHNGNSLEASNSLSTILQMERLLSQMKDSDWLQNGHTDDHYSTRTVIALFSNKDTCHSFAERLDSSMIAYRIAFRATKVCEEGYRAMLEKQWIYSIELWIYFCRKFFIRDEQLSPLVSKMLDNFVRRREKGMYRNIQVCLMCLSEELAEQLMKQVSSDSSVLESKGIVMARYATNLLDKNDPVLHYLVEKWASLTKEPYNGNSSTSTQTVFGKVSKQFYSYREAPPALLPPTLSPQLWDNMIDAERYAEDTLEAATFLEGLEQLRQQSRGNIAFTYRDGLLPIGTLREWSQYLLHNVSE